MCFEIAHLWGNRLRKYTLNTVQLGRAEKYADSHRQNHNERVEIRTMDGLVLSYSCRRGEWARIKIDQPVTKLVRDDAQYPLFKIIYRFGERVRIIERNAFTYAGIKSIANKLRKTFREHVYIYKDDVLIFESNGANWIKRG